MILRRATIADAALLDDWRGRAHVQAGFGAEDPPDWEEELSINEDWHDPVIAEVDGRPVGYMEIIDPAREPTHYWGDVEDNLRAIDIFIGNAADLGKGYGAQMMRLALARCFTPPEITAVIIDPLVSNDDAIRFYERLGFRHNGVRNFYGNDCHVMRLERKELECRNST